MNTRELAIRAQAFLFAEGGTLTLKKLMQLLECDQTQLESALVELSRIVEGTGLTLIKTDLEASLAVSGAAREHVQKAFLRDLGREIGDAGLEVLAILLYRGPSTRAHIDYTRGVNSTSTIRNLLARGLVERAENPSDAREYLYRPTVELLAHLGVTQAQDLPEYATIAGELAAFERAHAESSPFEEHESESDTEGSS